MAIITLKYPKPLGLPSGVTLQPNTPTVVHGWEGDKKSAIVRAWLKQGILREGDDLPSDFVKDEDTSTEGADTSGAEGDQDAGSQEEEAGDAAEPDTGESEEEAAQLPEDKDELIDLLAQKGIKADKRKSVKQLQDMLAES